MKRKAHVQLDEVNLEENEANIPVRQKTTEPKIHRMIVVDDTCGERQKQLLIHQLTSWGVSLEDMYEMLNFNYTTMPKMMETCTARVVCADGMVYGAIKNRCPICKEILLFDGCIYPCLANSIRRGHCTYFLRKVKRVVTPWRVPQSVKNRELKQWQPVRPNYIEECYFGDTLKENRTNVIKQIDLYKKLVFESGCKILDNFKCFLVRHDDFLGKERYLYALIHVTIDTRGKAIYTFTRKEKIYQDEGGETLTFNSMLEAKERFEETFLNATGNAWNMNIHKTFVRQPKRLILLDIESRLRYKKSEQIDDLHDQLVVKLNGIRIKGVVINDAFIRKALDWKTTFSVVAAYERLKSNCVDTQSLEQEEDGMKALVNQKDEDDSCTETLPGLRSLAILLRLITPPDVTAINIVDFHPDLFACNIFPTITRILNVLFECDYSGFSQMACNISKGKNVMHTTFRKIGMSGVLIVFNYESKENFLISLNPLGPCILKLFDSTDQGHHYFLEQQDSVGCNLSLLLRKAHKAFDERKSKHMICTVDAEIVPILEGKKKNMNFEVIGDMEEISLFKFDEEDSKDYGYLLIDENKTRVKMQLVFSEEYFKRNWLSL